MAAYRLLMSSTFYPGAANVKEALKIHAELKERDDVYLTIIIKKHGDGLWIHHNPRYAHDGVIAAMLGFVAACARQFSLTDTWSAMWHEGCANLGTDGYVGGVIAMDLATQAVTFIDNDTLLSAVEIKVEEAVAFNAELPFEVTVAHDMTLPTEWLEENAVGGWSFFSKVVGVDGDVPELERVFRFKEATDATSFKLKFGGLVQHESRPETSGSRR